MHRGFFLTSAVAAALTVTGCGPNKDAGLSLGVSISPDKAYIVSGKGISCVARATAKKDDSIPVADVSGDLVLFSRVALQWRSGDKLTISSVKATVFSAGISGADGVDGLEIIISEDELAALFGLPTLTIPFDTSVPHRADFKTDIDSTDPAAKPGSLAKPYVPCGLIIGGLAGKKDVKTYSARIRIELTGYKTACVLGATDSTKNICSDGELSPVRQSVTVTAQKF